MVNRRHGLASFGRIFTGLGRQATALALTLITFFPVYFLICTAFKTKTEFYTNKLWLPQEPTLTNFALVWQVGFLRYFINSIIVTIPTTLVGTFFASLAGFAISRMEFPGKRHIQNLMIVLIAVPVVVTIIPLYIMMAKLHLINNYLSAMLVFLGFMIPYSTFFLASFFKDIPQPIIDSARIDGCSTFRIYWNIMLPLSVPALVTKGIVGAFWVWSDLLIPLVLLQFDEVRTLPAALIAFRTQHEINVPAICAGSVVVIAPIVLTYVLGQRYFVKGMVEGSLQGTV